MSAWSAPSRTRWMLEYIPQLDPITETRLDIRNGLAHPPLNLQKRRGGQWNAWEW
jgi:hypothetical protein